MGERDDERRTVLVVDDDADTADMYTAYLADDYPVRTAYSGDEALAALDDDVAVVLLDRRMPGLSGDNVLRAIREEDIDCRVVMVTAISPEVGMLGMAFDDYLVKPVTGAGIRDAVARMLVRNTCDETIQAIVALASKMATLEAKMSLEELEASSVYATLETQLNDLRKEAVLSERGENEYVEFTDEKIRSLLG